ncbi:MAG: HYR domain-containing protein [Adhaeribacter sp.]
MSKQTIRKSGWSQAWRFLVAAWLLLPAGLSAQVLDNNQLRFGTGFEPSVNPDGNLQQPFYYNAPKRAWRKLTFYAYPLETAIGLGGDKTQEWNTNGTILEHPALQGQVLDTSGFVVTNPATGRGSGRIVSRGSIQIAGQALELENTYTLPAQGAFIQVQTRLKNQGPGLAENVRVWIGTRDDWVGTTDVPAKQKGDLVNGQFVAAAANAARASALQISSRDEGVFFYTDSPKANTIIQACCSFSNVIRQDPQTVSGNLSGDASYGVYVRLQDLEPGASDSFTWYYAAGEISLMPEILVEVAAALGGLRNISYTSATLQASASTAATGYWMVVPRTAPAPTAAQIKAGLPYGPALAASGSGAMAAGKPSDFDITGLSPATPYKLYFVAEEAAGGLSAVKQVPFTTQALNLPTLHTLAPENISATGAQGGGQIENDGGAPVTARGICWSTSGNPTTANSKTLDGTGLGAFSSTLQPLLPNTTYYVRAYATNSLGTSYGKLLYFKTSPAAPTSLTLSADNICVGSTSKISASGVQQTLYWYADSCGGTTLGSGNSLTVSPGKTTTYYARNFNGTYSDCAMVTVQVNQEPPLVAGKNITLNLQANRSAVLSPADIDQGSRDSCGPVTLAITAGKTSFDCSDLGQTYPVALTATDQQGLTATVTVQVTVADGLSYCNQPPVAVAKALTLAAGASCQASPAARDLDGGSTDADGDSLLFTLYPAGPFPLGTTPVTLTVRDAAGASSSASTTVTVVDTSAPVFSPVADLSVSTDPGVNGAVVHYQFPAASDNCGAATVQTAGLAPGSQFPVGTTTNTFQARDAAGNVSETSFTVTVTDTEAPVVVVKDLQVSLGETGQVEIACYQVNNGSTDNCGIAAYALDKTVFDCSSIGLNKVVLTVTDVHGNVAQAIALVTVEDKTRPTVVTRNIRVQLDASGQAAIQASQVDQGSYDACGIASFSLSKTSFSCSDLGANAIQVKVKDVHGNEAEASAQVTVLDITPPVARAKSLHLVTLQHGTASVTAQQLDEGSSDECGIASMTVSPASFSCDHIGLNTVTLTVTDKSGNVSRTTSTVFVQGLVPVTSIKVVANEHQHCTNWGCDHRHCADSHCRNQNEAKGQHCGHQDHDKDHDRGNRCGHRFHQEKEHHKSCGNSGAAQPASLDRNTIYLGYGPQSVVLDATGGAGYGSTYRWTGNGQLSSTSSGASVFAPEAAGVYTFTVVETNLYGCSASSSVTITVLDVRCGNKNDKVSICHKGQQICVAPSAVAAHLAHGDQIGPCLNQASANARMAREVEYAQVLGLTAYPNPARERTTIEFSMVSAGSYRLALFDMKGAMVRKIGSGQAETNQFFSFELSTGSLPPGVYLIRLSTDQQVATRKLVIEK